jgi:hypothetical protein
MKNKLIQLIILLTIVNVSLINAQQDDCANCPDCRARLTKGQEDLNSKLNKLEEASKKMEESYRKKLANSTDKNELERAKNETNQLAADNQSLNRTLADSRNTNELLSQEIVKLKEQALKQSEELVALKNDLLQGKKDLEKKDGIISGTATTSQCWSDLMNDKVAPKLNKIVFKGKTNFKLYEKNEPNSDLCVITFQENTATIKQVKVGDDVFTDTKEIQCVLRRVENLFYHYHDLLFLRIQVKYKDNKILAKERFNYIQDNFFKGLFMQDRNNENKFKADDTKEFKPFTIAKWGKNATESITISIAAEKDNNDTDLINK